MKKVIIFHIDHQLTNIESINSCINKFTARVPTFDFYSNHPLIHKLFVKNGSRLDTAPNTATHALVVGDNVTVALFNSIISKYKIEEPQIRYKYVPVTRVINIKKSDCQDYVYIGRGSKWGNPHSHLTGELDRDGAIAAFKYDFERNLFLNVDMKADIGEIRGKVLGCSCKPLDCHGDVLAAEANSKPFE